MVNLQCPVTVHWWTVKRVRNTTVRICHGKFVLCVVCHHPKCLQSMSGRHYPVLTHCKVLVSCQSHNIISWWLSVEHLIYIYIYIYTIYIYMYIHIYTYIYKMLNTQPTVYVYNIIYIFIIYIYIYKWYIYIYTIGCVLSILYMYIYCILYIYICS